MKKIVGSLVLVTLAIFAYSTAASAASFPDVPGDSENFAAVEYLKAKNIISGYPDNTFAPEKTINRAEALKIVILASGLSGVPEGSVPMQDVKDSDWFYDYVQTAYANKIINGYSDGTFKPGNNINVAESLKIIINSMDSGTKEAPLKNPYPDVEVTAWYSSFAQYAKTKQVIWPLDDGKLHAERDITRGEFAQIIYRLMYMKTNKLESFPLSTDWPLFTDNANGYSIKYPFSWNKITAGSQTVFWKKDAANEQLSWARVYPESATLVVAVDVNENRYSLDQYLSLIKYDDKAQIQKMTLNGYNFASVSLIDSGLADYYFELPNKSILVVYGQVGNGLSQPFLLEEIRYMIGSIRDAQVNAQPQVTDAEKFLSDVRKLVLVNGKGQAALDMFSDLLIIETDSIGIGTGPVDYYFSPTNNVTLKFERNSLTLLAINEEKTTAF